MSQRRMGPAPFASFEDLSDEVRHGVESPTSAAPVAPTARLPEIREQCDEHSQRSAAAVVQCLQTPNTPRIDISRASSSSHHEEDSRDSTPERELFEPQCSRLGPAFREDGAADLRSSTEELDFQDEQDRAAAAAAAASARHSDHESAGTAHTTARKDSQGSDMGFLSVSGRTSRLSSVGSQGSRASNASGLSRSPSPHKMLLETSFCGTKGSATGAVQPLGGSSALEHALLSRKQDPTEAVLAEGISIELRKKIQPVGTCSPKRKRTPLPIPIVVEPASVVATDEIDRPVSPGKTIIAESGVEYTFIPLKGPLPAQLAGKTIMNATRSVGASKRSNPTRTNKTPVAPPRARQPPPPPPHTKASGEPSSKAAGEPQYIRIKLKPDHMYADGGDARKNVTVNTNAVTVTGPEIHKPVTLNLNNGTGNRPAVCTASAAAVNQPPQLGGSPKLPRLRDSRTPSPSVSRKSSFTSLFRSKEAVVSSPESPGDRTRSKSKEREHIHMPNVFGIFKPKKSCIKKQTSPDVMKIVSPLPSLEFTFSGKPQKEKDNSDKQKLKYYETPLEGDSVRIPLHSPGTEPEPLVPTSSPPPPTLSVATPGTSQGTPSQPAPHDSGSHPTTPAANPRHSSTSSENIIFTTNLGSNNDIFTTKLPKEKGRRITENHCEKPVERKLSTESNRSPPPAEASAAAEKRDTSPAAVVTASMTRSESSESEREIREPMIEEEGSERGAAVHEDDHELKTLVFQQDSFEDDDLPYVPTTLPLERSVAVPIVPVKQRGEIRMCPIERPRSTTPINPSCLEEYCEDGVATAEPKLRISLPKDEPAHGRGKSPRKWSDFAEKDMGGSSSPPPLPPRGAPRDWINFEEVPERRKPPKRIQVIPTSGGRTVAEENVVYSYVNPEDCKCECHEQTSRAGHADHHDRPTPDAFPDQHKFSS